MHESPRVTFDAQAVAKRLLREARSAALATVTQGSGHPYCSLVNVGTTADGAPILLISTLAIHTRNIAADPRVSLLLREGAEGDPLEGARVSIQGRATIDRGDETRRRYLARHPQAAMFADFKDFSFYRVALSGAHLVAGFGRIVDLPASALTTEVGDTAALVAAEAEICAHMNEDHAGALALYATKLLGAPVGSWRCVGADPEGLELECDGVVRRLPFPSRATTPGQMRAMLKALADTARNRAAENT